MNKDVHISVIVPAYKEATRIGTTLASLNRYFSDKPFSYEIIVVEDGSPDNTYQVVTSYSDTVKNLTVLKNEKNRGKGYSVCRGMQAATGKFRVFMDADNSVDISHLDAFLKEVHAGNDVVIGSIKMGNTESNERNGLHRKILSALSALLIRTVVGKGIHDTQRGFKVFSARAAEHIFPKQTIERFGFDIEILVIAREQGFKIKELPVVWDNPTGSTVTMKSYIDTLRELIRISFNRLTGKYAASKLYERSI